ncbi:putative ribonuclease H-like domain-containing protein [Tanacetum coccineum]
MARLYSAIILTADPPLSQSSKSSPDAGFKPSRDDENKVTEEPGKEGEEGIDYDEVFAPVARIEAIRLFLAYASFKDFMLNQIYSSVLFLYGKD